MNKDWLLIIPFRHNPDDHSRLTSLNFILQDYNKKYPEMPICLVEMSSEPQRKLITDFSGEYINIPSSGPFNKSLIHNTAFRHFPNYKYYLYCDNDVYFHEDSLQKACEFQVAGNYESISPKQQMYDLDYAQTQTVFNGTFTPGNYSIRAGLDYASAAVFYTREGFVKSGGWDERFAGWGAEDNIVSLIILRYLTYSTYPGNIYHLYHMPVNIRETPTTQRNYRNNCLILRNYQRNLNKEYAELRTRNKLK